MLTILDRPHYHPPITQPDILVPPAASTVFTGRQDLLSRLITCFYPRLSPGTQRILILHGELGAGKTEIGLEFCRQHLDWFHVVWFIDASSAGTLQSNYDTIGTALGITNPTILKIRQGLEKETKEWLLFFDNVFDPSALDQYIPSCTHGNILITSRHSGTQKYAPDSTYHVGAMEPADATSLLLKASNTTTENTEAVQLVQELHHCPISIIHAASVIRSSHKPTTFSEYLSTYSTTRTDVERIASVQKETCTTSVYITLDVIFRTLSPTAIDLINLVPFLYNENIPHTLFQNAFIGISRYESIPDGWDDAVQFLSAFKGSSGEWDNSLLQQVLDELCSFSLLKPNTMNMYSIPPFIHTWLNGRLTNHDRQRHRCTAGHILGLAIAKNFEARELSFRQCFYMHIKHWMFSDLSDFDARLGLPFTSALSERGWSEEIVDMIQRIVDVQKRELGERNEETLEGLYQLAEALRHMHHYIKSSEIWKEVLEARKEVLGENHRLVFRTMNRLALCLYQLGRTNEVEKACLETLERQRALFGECDRDTLETLHTLGLCYAEQHRTVEASERLQKNLNLRTQLFGERHPPNMRTVAALALVYVYDGRWKEAQELAEMIVDVRGKGYGEDHPWYLDGLQSLASTYRGQREYTKAEELLENGIILAENSRLIGARHPDVLSTRYALSLVYYCQGRYEEAGALQLELLAKRKEILGPEHEHVVVTMVGLAYTYHEGGRIAESEALFREVLDKRRKTFGPDHPSTLAALFDLAFLLSKGDEKLSEAQEAYLLCLEKRKEVLVEDHPETLRTMGNLACVYKDQKRYYEAQQLEERLYERQKQRPGVMSKDMIWTVLNLIETYRLQRKLVEATNLGVETLGMLRASYCEDHTETLEVMAALGNVYYEQSRFLEGAKIDEQVVEGHRRKSGEEHKQTLVAKQSLACTYFSMGRWDEAEQLQWQVLIREWSTRGEEHEQTLQNILNLSYTYHAEGRVDEATDLQQVVKDVRARSNGSDGDDN